MCGTINCFYSMIYCFMILRSSRCIYTYCNWYRFPSRLIVFNHNLIHSHERFWFLICLSLAGVTINILGCYYLLSYMILWWPFVGQFITFICIAFKLAVFYTLEQQQVLFFGTTKITYVQNYNTFSHHFLLWFSA